MYIIYLIAIVILFLLVYFVIDYRGPKYIALRPARAFNMECWRAKELIIHEVDLEGSVWASRGMLLYHLKNGDRKFVRVAHIPTGYSYYWLNNFTLFRRLTNKAECLEVTITDKGDICALSAGYMWHKPSDAHSFIRTMELPYYGFGVGRGIFSNGLLSVDNNEVFWGEYHRNTERKCVNIYRSKDGGLSWDVAYEFEPGVIRHVHTIQKDPYSDKIWLCTGDYDNESMIGWSDDGLLTINYIGSGSQIWRSCQLVFTADAIYWGTDTGSEDLSGIYRWGRTTKKLEKIAASAGAILYGTILDEGTILFSTDREGFSNEKDMRTSLFVFKENNEVSELKCGTWKHWKKGYRYSFAALKIQRNYGSTKLFFSIMNQKEFPNGELLMIDKDEIINSAASNG